MKTETNIIEKKVRQSNMELLRIVAMSFIVIHHFWRHGMLYSQFPYPAYEVLEGFSMGGVDLFIMISGFFGIRLSWRAVIGLVLTVAFFFLINIGVASSLFDNVAPADKFADFVIAPLSNSGYWFIATYFILMLLSPILNGGLRALSLPQLRGMVMVLTVVEFYTMAIIGNRVDVMGTGIFSFIYLYLLGHYLRKEEALSMIRTWWFPVISIVAAMLSIGIELAIQEYDWVKSMLGKYLFVKQSNPLTIISKAALLCWFTRFKFQRRWVNSLAGASFGVYLLQDGVGGEYLYNWQRAICGEWGFGWEYLLLLFGIFTALWTASWILTKIKDLFTPYLTDKIVGLIPSRLRQPLQ